MAITINIPGASTSSSSTGVSTHTMQVNHMDDTVKDVLYVGKEDSTSAWLVQKLDDTGATTVITYATTTNNQNVFDYTVAWAARLTLTYTTVSGA